MLQLHDGIESGAFVHMYRATVLNVPGSSECPESREDFKNESARPMDSKNTDPIVHDTNPNTDLESVSSDSTSSFSEDAEVSL